MSRPTNNMSEELFKVDGKTSVAVSYTHLYNLEIIPKERYAQTILKDGDEVEIVSFMGGGSK